MSPTEQSPWPVDRTVPAAIADAEMMLGHVLTARPPLDMD